jgi:hypothetical protein
MGGDYYDRDVVATTSTTTYSDQSAKMVGTQTQMHRSMDPTRFKDDNLVSENLNPIVFALDVTGSMGEWTRIIYDKMPMFYGQILMQNYLEDPAISFCAVGDYTSDEAPLQVTEFAQGKAIDQLLSKMYIECGGGGTCNESYELAAYFYNNHVDLSGAQLPFFFVTGDESFYEKIPHKYITKFIGKTPVENSINARECWKILMTKFNVFLIKKPYEEEKKEIQILKQWIETIGEERVLQIVNPKACIDVILGAIAITSGHRTLSTYIDDMKARGQTEDRIEEVTNALSKYNKKFAEIRQRMMEQKKTEEVLESKDLKANLPNLLTINSHELFQKETDPEKLKLREDLVAMKNVFKGEIPDNLICPITSDIFVDPVMTSDGHTYERMAIEAWFEKHHSSPQTNLVLPNKNLIPNFVIKQLVKAFYEENIDRINN